MRHPPRWMRNLPRRGKRAISICISTKHSTHAMRTPRRCQILPRGDGQTYAFPLRSGVHFHNGKAIGPADIVASLERHRKIGASPALLSAVDRIEASGPLEVTIRLKQTQSSFIDNISSPRAPIAIYPAEEAAKQLKDFSLKGEISCMHSQSRIREQPAGLRHHCREVSTHGVPDV
jgi:hypothetical protein